MRSYCVVGGGISGLTAAYRLRRAVGDDAVITVLDPADRLGGILRTEQVGGQPMDIGAEAFVARRREVPELLAGTVNGIPSAAAAMAGLVDAETVDRMGREPSRPMHWRAGMDPTVGDLVGDRFGAQVVARSVDPMLSGVYAGSAATIGLRSAVPTVAGALDAGAPNLTEAVRSVLPAGPGVSTSSAP